MAQPIIQLSGIGRSYPQGDGALTVLRDVDLSIAPGEFVAIMGASGSGKTTIGRAAVALLGVREGKLTVAGRDITNASNADLRPFRKTVGIVFQDPGSSLNPRLPVG